MSRFEEQAAEIMASSWSYPGLMERKAEELLLVFSRNNSLGTWSTWSIFLHNMQFFIRRIEWPRRLDRLELTASSPSTFGSESMIRKSSAEAIVDSAVFLFNDERQQETCELTIDGVYGSVSLPWNSNPFSWIRNRSGSEEFDLWLAQAENAADACLPQSSYKGV